MPPTPPPLPTFGDDIRRTEDVIKKANDRRPKVYEWWTDGVAAKDIAVRLGCSYSTVQADLKLWEKKDKAAYREAAFLGGHTVKLTKQEQVELGDAARRMLAEGSTFPQIADTFRVTLSQVRYAVNGYT